MYRRLLLYLMNFPVKKTEDGRAYLNVGCGALFFADWNNIDLFKHADVHNYDVRRGLPYPDNTFDVVYSSHTLEHFSHGDGKRFIAEMHRVLKPGGIIRLAVPDLEQIAREYIARLDDAKADDTDENRKRLQWITYELFDQMTRTVSGGEMLKALKAGTIDIAYIEKRAGDQFQYFYTAHEPKEQEGNPFILWLKNKLRPLKQRILRENDPDKHGELHKWMYDEYSLGRTLAEAGFTAIAKQHHNTSKIPGWAKRNLDASAYRDSARKPDSLFIEALKH